MKSIKHLFINYIINTHIWVALAFSSLFKFYNLTLTNTNDYKLETFTFFSTLFIYNLSHKSTYNFSLKSYTNWTKTLLLLSIILILSYTFYFNYKSLLLLCFTGLISILYSIPIRNITFRTIPRIKLFIIAFVWALTLVLLPILQAEKTINYIHLLYLLQAFLYVLAITIPFDIRDLRSDNLNLKTLPILIGISKSKQIALLFMLSAFLINFGISPLETNIVFGISCLISGFMIYKSSIDKKSTYYTFWLESCSMLPLILNIIFEYYL